MIRLRRVLIVVALLLIGVAFYYVDTSDLSWKRNSGAYIGIFSMTLLIIAMIGSNKLELSQPMRK